MTSHTPRPVVILALTVFSEEGGIQRYVRRMVRSLTELVGQSEVGPITLIALRDKAGVAIPSGFNFRPCDGSTFKFVIEILKALASRSRPIVFCTHVFLAPFAALLSLKSGHKRTFVVAHGTEVWEVMKPAGKIAIRVFRPTVLAVSRLTANRMRAVWGISTEISLLPCAVDIPTDTNQTTREPQRVVTVARLNRADSTKHVAETIEAVAELRAKGVPVQLTVIGDGDDRTRLRALVNDLECEDSIRLLGWVSDQKLAEEYRQAAIFALPSTQEGFGIVYLEAWVNGLAVIGGNDGAAPEVIDAGIDGLIASPSPLSIAERLETLLTQPDKTALMAKAGRAKVETHYSHAAFTRNLAAIIEGA